MDMNGINCIEIDIKNRGGVTKLISSILLISQFFSIIRTLLSYWIPHSYLAGVIAARLQWHLSSMNVIQRN